MQLSWYQNKEYIHIKKKKFYKIFGHVEYANQPNQHAKNTRKWPSLNVKDNKSFKYVMIYTIINMLLIYTKKKKLFEMEIFHNITVFQINANFETKWDLKHPIKRLNCSISKIINTYNYKYL